MDKETKSDDFDFSEEGIEKALLQIKELDEYNAQVRKVKFIEALEKYLNPKENNDE